AAPRAAQAGRPARAGPRRRGRGTPSARVLAPVGPGVRIAGEMAGRGRSGWKRATGGVAPMSNAPAVSGEICQYEWSPEAACVPNPNPKNTTTVTTGVTNRPGNQAPAANPVAVSAGTPAALTAAGHHSGPPQVAWRAVMT